MEDKQKEYYKSLYEKLLSKYTKEELAEAFVFPPDLNAEEEEEAERQLREDRLKRLANRTPEERVLSGILRIKYQMKEYIDQARFDQNKTTPHFLKEYLKATDKKQQELAADIGLHVARLSRILNGKERLSLSIAYRLEAHSGDLIPAIMWWKVVQKEVEQEIRTDEEKRKEEQKKVINVGYQRA